MVQQVLPKPRGTRQRLARNEDSSSFYDRPNAMVENLQAEIGQQYVHEVVECDYYVRGKDHLGCKTINQYSVIKELGAGAFGTVYKVKINETHEDMAMKIYSKSILSSKKDTMVKDETSGRMVYKNYLNEIRKEIDIMKRLNSTNVVRLQEVIDSNDEDKLILIIDFCAKGEILNWDSELASFTTCLEDQEQLTESQIRQFMRDLTEGLDHLHKSKICHRDIKPMNILVDQNNVCKFADFGASDFFKNNNSDIFQDSVGTYQFFSPEMCNPEVTDYSGRAADIWALGITLFAMTFNVLPFDKENETDLFQHILNDELVFPSSRSISEGLRSLIAQMLEKNPTRRITIEQMKTNAWLNEGYQVSLADFGAEILVNLSDK